MLLTTIRTARQRAENRAVRRAAFTLLEVLIVVAILVILASAASIALFRYLEDAKVGRAKTDMKTIETAIKTYYAQNGEWPPQQQGGLAAVAPLIEQGQHGLIDPWGGQYSYSLQQTQDMTDGTTREYPVVMCQPPGGKPAIYVPDIQKLGTQR